MVKRVRDGLPTADEWEIADDVTVQRPVGVVLSVRLDRASMERILTAAEALGMSSVEFVERAAGLVAAEPALQRRLHDTESPR